MSDKILTVNKMYRNITSSFNGNICEIPGICVDNFENPLNDEAKAYFLSHYHTDHTVGLDKNELYQKLVIEKNVFIYATKMTAAIIVYNNMHLKDYIKVLNSGSNLITIPSDSERNQPETFLNVKLIPAGHCLGSTMFLFETTSVKVLYTGDFRIRPNDLPKYTAFHNKDGDILKLDALYVDTTFIGRHESFPKRSDSIEEAIALIGGLLQTSSNQCVILDTSANYGYEYIFNQIYEVLGCKVYVDDRKWCFYSSILHLVPGVTNNAEETRIFLKRIPESKKALVPTKRIRFSAIRWDNWNEDNSSVTEEKFCIYVCFSTHCSRNELISFVEYLNPVKVVGFPNPYRIKPSPVKVSGERCVLSPIKSPRKRPCPSITSYRKDKKVDEAVLRKIFG